MIGTTAKEGERKVVGVIECLEVDWSFEPPNLLEGEVTIVGPGLTIGVGEGTAHAQISGCPINEVRRCVEAAQAALEDHLRGAQLVELEPFSVKVKRIQSPPRADGSADAYGMIASVVITSKMGRVDAISTDAAGKVVRDTKRDRISRKRLLGERVAKHRATDRTLQRMLRSFDAAMRDPADELLHLYEVWEAFKTKLAATDNVAFRAYRQIGKDLGNLANDGPLLQGRHRGRYADEDLRSATQSELLNARQWAASLVEGYLNWLK